MSDSLDGGADELKAFVNGWLVEVSFGTYDREYLPILADEMLEKIAEHTHQAIEVASKKVGLTQVERWQYEKYQREHEQALEDYHEFGKAPVDSPERMAAYISQLSLHNLRRGADMLAEWRQQAVEKARVSELQKLVRFLKLAHLYDQDSAMKLRYHIDNRLAELASTQPEKDERSTK